MWRRLMFGLTWGVMLAACGPRISKDPQNASRTDAVNREAGKFAALVLAEGRATPACGTRTPTNAGDDLLLLTTEICFTCRDVGRALREVQRSRTAEQAPLRLVTPMRDTLAVCRYMRRERIRLPVFALSSFPDTLFPGRLVYVRTDSSGAPSKTGIAVDGPEFLKLFRESPSRSTGGTPAARLTL